MKASHRAERLADELRMQLGQILGRLNDPRIGFATVTEVRLSPDLRHARVHVSVLGDADAQRKSLECLEAARAYLRKEVARHLTLRFTPELSFELDRGAEYIERVEELLRRSRKSR
jgi:ribosome-binding factor A